MGKRNSGYGWGGGHGGGGWGGGWGWGHGKPRFDLGDLTPRPADGHNVDGDNNSANDRGYAHDTFVRVTPNSYSDGVGALPTGLPAPRAISDAVMNQKAYDGDGNNAVESSIPSSAGLNEWFQFFGQVLTHDMAEAATGNSGPNNTPEIALPPGQGLPFPVIRTPYELEGGVRQQINEETSFLDLSQVYGNSDAMKDLVRADGGSSAKLLVGANGLLPTIAEATYNKYGDTTNEHLLQVLSDYRPDGFGGLPDPALASTAAAIDLTEGSGSWVHDYLAGDNRANQTPLLIAQQTVWAQNHNYWVDQLAMKNPDMSDDQLFNAARAINEGEWQNVVYNEYLPKLVGEHAMSEYSGYDPSVDPSIINEWTTVAFRFGHDQSGQTQTPLDENGNPVATGQFDLFTLADAFAAGADGARTVQDYDSLIRGQMAAVTQEIDGLVVDGNRNTLFGIGGGPVVADLEVFDIQRARDHGVWNYNDLREGLGFDSYTDFDAYFAANNIDPTSERAQALVGVYGNDIDKLDSIVGGLMEEKYYDSQLGETFTKLTVQQFENVRDGDPMYYENQFKDDPKMIELIESSSMSEIIARNSTIDHVYRDAFLAHDRITDTDGTIDGSDATDLAIGSDYADTIKTGKGNDDAYGGNGADKIRAGGGDDIVNGEAGDDWLWGDAGYDIFDFDPNGGKDVVKDFNVKQDKIDLSDYGYSDYNTVKQYFVNTRGGVTLQFDEANSVQLVGVKAKQLSENQFIYDDTDNYTALA